MGNIDENRNYSVYIHTSPSGKMYVGLTSSKPRGRWGKSGAGYLCKNKNGKYNQPAFAYAIQKYGWDNFKHKIVANNLTKNEADNLERLLIEKFDTRNPKYGYNIKEGGSNGSLSEETKKKIGKSLKGKNKRSVVQYSFSGELICVFDNMTEAELKIGVSHSHISSCCSGKRRTAGGFIWRYHGEELTKEHLAWCNEMLPDKFFKKRVVQYSLSGELINIFESMSEAELRTGIPHSNISAVCNGRNKTAGGFVWEYYNEENLKIAI